MADSKSNDPKANEVKPGVVRPPVLDLKARSAEADAVKSEASTANTKPTGSAAPSAAAVDKPKSTDKPKPAPSPKPSSDFGFGSALIGGLLGLGAAYGLAYAGLWPSPPAMPIVADPRLAAYGKLIPELETVIQTTRAELAKLNQRVATLEKAKPVAIATDPVDLSAIEGDVAALTARVDKLAAAPAAVAGAGAMDGLRSDLAALGTRLDELAARTGTAEASLRTIDTTVAQTSAALAAQLSDITAVLQLPLILSGFETAFATGRPYETELAALRAAAPEASIPTLIANQAPQGLTRPDIIARRFDAVLPAILAGRPADPDAQWQQGALDWFASAIALRPTGEIEGDGPEDIISRLIGAVDRRDFVSAQSLLGSLPAPMQAAADDVPTLIAEQAGAETFLQSLRDAALSGEVAK
ncbi:MAG: hypothetical protein MO846_09970 [Candidatus Devosia symbiotica]|nr:hypothetical protein [Candidatus Devosia symbiotica]